MDKPKLQLPTVRNPKFNSTRLAINFLNKIAALKGEPVQVNGLNNLSYSDNTPIPGPFVWALNHDSRNDAATIPPAYFQLPLKDFTVKAIVRYEPFGIPFLDTTIRKFFGDNAHFVHRTRMLRKFENLEDRVDLSREGKEKLMVELSALQQHNKSIFNRAWQEYEHGIHVAIMAEGTSKNSGRLTRKSIKTGVYRLAVQGEGGKFRRPKVVPAGVTVDFMGNKSGLEVPCIHFGQPYSHVSTDMYPTDHDRWPSHDKAIFNRDLRIKLGSLTTLTISNLVGEHLYTILCLSQRNIHTGIDRIRKLVDNRIDYVSRLKDISIEKKLLDPESREERFQNFLYHFESIGYGHIKKQRLWLNPQKLQSIPLSKNKAKSLTPSGNPLQFMVNRVYNLIESRPDVKEMFDKSRYTI
jgi:hypothetical protein